MSTTTPTPLEWIRKIPRGLLEFDEIPLLGHPPEFPWGEFTAKLAKSLEINDLKIEHTAFQWRGENELFAGMGKPLAPLTFSVAPFEGALYWAMAGEDIIDLMHRLLGQDSHLFNGQEKEYSEAFYQFLALEVINALENSAYNAAINPQLVKPSVLPEKPMLAMDIQVSFGGKTKQARLFLSPELRQSIKKHYLNEAEKAPFRSPLSKKLEVTIHLEAGATALSLKEWSKTRPGDFLLLEKCTLIPGKNQGQVILTINGVPFFLGTLENGNIKLLEPPQYYEVNQVMNVHNPDDEEEYEDEDEDEDEFEDEDEEDEEEDEEEEEESDSSKAQARLVPAGQKKSAASAKDIPVSVVVEVGRVNMTVQTLMDLSPGNLLELNVNPESGVDLVVNGSRVAKGELLQIGETLGVRILEMG